MQATLKPWQLVFIDEWIKNGGNGTQAYMQARPKCKESTAVVRASKTLKDVHVKAEIERRKQALTPIEDEGELSSFRARHDLITRAKAIHDKAMLSDKLDTALKSIETESKLRKMHIDGENEADKYARFLGNVLGTAMVTGNQVNPPSLKGDVVDVDDAVPYD